MKFNFYVILLALFSIFVSCEDSINENIIDDKNEEIITDLDISDWSESTHSKGVKPDYETVFPQDIVNRIDIELSTKDWETMIDDMTQNYGGFGSNASGGPPIPGSLNENPVYVPCSVFFADIQWYKVGIRFKGNSSLRASWEKGIWKIPLRLNFDKFEDEYPQINNQRFYGFKELSLGSNFDDKSLIREKVVPEIFRDLGLVALQTSFYRIYLDYGEGPIYFGLYTMVEVVDDTMIENQFPEENGNLYKPEGPSASFANNIINYNDFEKKTNEETDWSDIESLFNVLHSTQRTSDPNFWKNSLEQVFNVDVFLKWLAVNTTIQNWDTYGNMTHNYYLYNNPSDNLLTWIPWDNNESLQFGKMGGAISISCNDVNNDWPLIRYLLDDEIYLAKYKVFLKQTVETAFAPSKIIPKYQQYGNLIREYVVGTNGEKTN